MRHVWVAWGALFVAATHGVAQEPVVASNPRWSPDGVWVVFYANTDGQTDIYRQRVADGRLERLTSGPEMDYGPDYSPDGQWLVYYSGSGSAYALTLMRTDGSERHQIGCGGEYEGNPHFSHDGRRLAFSSNRDGNHEIYVINVDGSGCRRITRDPATDQTPRFSPDDRSLVFSSKRAGDYSIYTVDVDGEDEPRLVADRYEHDYYPDWSPDGRRVAFFSGPDFDHFEIYVVDLGDGSTLQVTAPPWTATSPAWRPDGQYLLIGATRDAREEMMLVQPDGTGLRPAIGGG